MNFQRHLLAFVPVCAVFAVLSASLSAQNPSAVISGRTIPDVELVDQHGKKVHFYSDLVKDKVVAISTIFTSCSTICPITGVKFSELSRLLASDGPGKLSLISISIDPQVDTPQLLDRWSRGFGTPGPAWTLVTGPKSEVDRLLKGLGIFSADKQEHSPDFLIGGEGTGDWAHPSSAYTASQLVHLVRARLELASGHATVRR
jgi:protein SCO1